MMAKIGELAYSAGVYLALGIFLIFLVLAFREFSDQDAIWGFLQFGILISCLPWAIGSAVQLLCSKLVENDGLPPG
jgi:hypothetical protein